MNAERRGVKKPAPNPMLDRLAPPWRETGYSRGELARTSYNILILI
jgi:hypothetical protein